MGGMRAERIMMKVSVVLLYLLLLLCCCYYL
jgi:hypothetical protein